MTPSEVWWLLPPDSAAPHRRRHTVHLERLYGRRLADTAVVARHCPDYPDCPNQPCRGCRVNAQQFDAWTATQ